MLDRTIAPSANPIDNINFVMPEKWELNNKIPVFEYNLSSQDVIKLDFVFKAGTKYQNKPLVASTVKNVLKEGTSSYDSKQIADVIDFYGAYFETELTNDYLTVSLYALTKHADNVLPIIADILLNATFPQSEIDKYLAVSKQNFIIGQEKVGTLSSQAYVKNIFEGSQYGQVAKLEDYENVTQKDLINFHKTYLSFDNVEIFIAGKINAPLKGMLNQYIGEVKRKKKSKISFDFTQPNFEAKKVFVEKKGAIQSAIRFGKPMFKINHKDYVKFQVLNTVLGGYFGSRLMMNIREDKGYTYGIGSGIASKQEMGNFVISTEVGSEVTHQTITEINNEINKLKTDLIPEKELHTVKNYLLGSLLQNTDGPFDLLERFKTIHNNNLDDNHYDYFIEEINKVTAEDLKDLANKHLNDFTIIVAGSVDFE